MNQDAQKKAAAEAAIAHVPHDAVIGVGTGSTANHFIQALAGIKARIAGAVASSEATAAGLKALGIPVLELAAVDEIPVYVDSADEVTRHLGHQLERKAVVPAKRSKPFRTAVDSGCDHFRTRPEFYESSNSKWLQLDENQRRLARPQNFPPPKEFPHGWQYHHAGWSH
jgi:hypothetical protein